MSNPVPLFLIIIHVIIESELGISEVPELNKNHVLKKCTQRKFVKRNTKARLNFDTVYSLIYVTILVLCLLMTFTFATSVSCSRLCLHSSLRRGNCHKDSLTLNWGQIPKSMLPIATLTYLQNSFPILCVLVCVNYFSLSLSLSAMPPRLFPSPSHNVMCTDGSGQDSTCVYLCAQVVTFH